MINEMIKRNALFVVNHSGGKDSQAMLLKLRGLVPASQLIIVHASLGRFEWGGAIEHIENTCFDLPVIICKNLNKDFLQMVRHRKKWPSPQQRQCTSDLKRGPIERTIRQHLKAHPLYNGLIVNCMGMRAQESPSRAKLETFKFHARNSKAGRQWYDWLPIHDWDVNQVFESIRQAGQTPHPIYAAGMTRFSCRFCIMASKADLQTAARLDPKTYAEIVETEKQINHTFIMPRKGCKAMGLEEYLGIPANSMTG